MLSCPRELSRVLRAPSRDHYASENKRFIFILSGPAMSHPKPPEPCLFFCNIIFKDEAPLSEAINRLSGLWGAFADVPDHLPFTWTTFYEKEMGSDLRRAFVCFSTLLGDPSDLSGRKHQAHGIEEALSLAGNRRVNLDPGYLNSYQAVIATFKPFAHRIALGRGVYAHLEYLFKHGEPTPLPWTYPDFRSEEYRAIFRRWRGLYLDLRQQAPDGGLL